MRILAFLKTSQAKNSYRSYKKMINSNYIRRLPWRCAVLFNFKKSEFSVYLYEKFLLYHML